jgi:hypothetical protein
MVTIGILVVGVAGDGIDGALCDRNGRADDSGRDIDTGARHFDDGAAGQRQTQETHNGNRPKRAHLPYPFDDQGRIAHPA